MLGRTKDTSGAALPGVTIVLEAGRSRQIATSGPDGTFVLSAVPSGPVTMTAQIPGFASESRAFVFDQQPQQVDFTLPVGALSETVSVAGQSVKVEGKTLRDAEKPVEPSQNVINLQRRTRACCRSVDDATRGHVTPVREAVGRRSGKRWWISVQRR